MTKLLRQLKRLLNFYVNGQDVATDGPDAADKAPVTGSMIQLQRLLNSRYRISTQLYLAFGGAVALTVAAGLVGWFSFNSVGEAQSQVNEKSIPEMATAFGVAQYSSSLVAGAPRLIAARTPEDLERIYAGIAESNQGLEEQLVLLEGTGLQDELFQRIRSHSHALISNVDDIKDQKTELIVLAEGRENLRRELAEVRTILDATLVPAIDDQLFYTVTGYRELGDPPAETTAHFSPEEVDRYRLLAELLTDANIATELLGNAFTLSDAASLEPLRERFEAAMSRIERNLGALRGSPVHAELTPVFARLEELGTARESGFNLLYRELRLVGKQQALLEENQGEAVDLVAEVDGLVVLARASAQRAANASSQAILTGRTLLLVISALSILGAVLIAWLLVGRVLLNRIEMLADWMRRMADGDLDASVGVGGNDEIAEMAAALEVFRRHALEVQRLNLVERLAEELQGKNSELERAMINLRQAQDQVVAQQKLASLGELTAGVAHEIRNPLNFIKNFSESSAELLTEMQETLDEGGKDLSDNHRELIREITEDLNSNLERIRNHGDRANRIVHDMLMMSRGSGEFQPTNINNLLDEHARLAYHSARATDPNFQLDFRQDLDPELGEMQVVPQDLGRVFLNMVSNACYATNEKQIAAREINEDYYPMLQLTTRRGDNAVEISIRDNGSGVPPEVIEKIFNPFFTTKPTDQGTGLGLAISNDIVRQHGGVIRVNSEPGEFTEMLVELPLTPPTALEEEEVALSGETV